MLTKNPSVTLPMRQSPDVKGVTIDFGGAPDHGRWRPLIITVRLRSKCGEIRHVKWANTYRLYVRARPNGGKGAGQYPGNLSNQVSRRTDERVEHIRLDEWELKEE